MPFGVDNVLPLNVRVPLFVASPRVTFPLMLTAFARERAVVLSERSVTPFPIVSVPVPTGPFVTAVVPVLVLPSASVPVLKVVPPE
jgi:hypothetical protein